MHELVPGLLIALDQDRIEDAVDLARTLVDECDEPETAVMQVAIAANVLHSNPQTPLAMLAVLVDKANQYTDDRTLGDISDQFLAVIAEQLESDADEPLSESAQQFLSEFDMRPGSSEVVRQLVQVSTAVIADFTLRAALLSAKPGEAVEARRKALDYVREAVVQHRGADGGSDEGGGSGASAD